MIDVSHSEHLLQLVDERREELVGFYRDLVRIPSVWGEVGPLNDAVDLISSTLRDAGAEVQHLDSGTEGIPMVLARIKGAAGGPTLMLNGHMEVYPPSDSWSMGPFEGVIRDNRLYGQGSADMKGGTAGMTMAAALLAREGVELPGDLLVHAIPNHFDGGEGTRKVLRDGIRPDFAIVTEPTDLEVVTGQRGILYLTITVTGRAAHTTALHIGVNAIERASRVVTALQSMVPRDTDGNPVEEHKILNVAQVDGGILHNLIPERCVLTVDIRFPPSQKQDDVIRDVRETIAATLDDLEEFPVTVEPEATCRRNPRSAMQLTRDHPLGDWVLAADSLAAGRQGKIGFHPAWPDTPCFGEIAGIPALTYGPGKMQAYWDDEYVDLDDYIVALKTYCVAAATRPVG
jgi:acetylornithine deacetylase/succinyl-diaminopimelate desuccinylase-like protein